MDESTLRNQALHWAWETHRNRFNIETKPRAEEIIEIAQKFYDFLSK
jgi:hypothetical protein